VELDLQTNAPPLDLVWLNPSEFVWLEAGAIDDAKQTGSQWTVQKLPHKGQIASLTALDPHTIAWVQDNRVHRLDLAQVGPSFSPDTSTVWFDPQLPKLMSLSYARETHRLLLDDTVNGQHTARWLDAADVTKPGVKIVQGYFLRNVQWTGPDSIGFTRMDATSPGLESATMAGKRTPTVLVHEKLEWFKLTPDGKAVYFFGGGTNEPIAGIWRYTFASSNLEAVVSGTEHPSPYAKIIDSQDLTFQTPAGKTLKYTVFPPANFNPHRKYPLILGQTVIWNRDNKANLAACGAYVALVTRESWFKGIEDWQADTLALYDQMKTLPYIDTSRVFMLGTSAETKYMSDCMALYPGMWKGGIFLEDDQLPDFSPSPRFESRPKIFLCSGSEDQMEPRFKQFQKEAIRYGVLVEYVIHPGENHVLVGVAGRLARMQAIARFLQED
jgi:dipeptidyl aminopeptidase/acylaminoacyl peptidase